MLYDHVLSPVVPFDSGEVGAESYKTIRFTTYALFP